MEIKRERESLGVEETAIKVAGEKFECRSISAVIVRKRKTYNGKRCSISGLMKNR